MCKKTQQSTVTVTYSNLINYNAPPFLNIVRFHWIVKYHGFIAMSSWYQDLHGLSSNGFRHYVRNVVAVVTVLLYHSTSVNRIVQLNEWTAKSCSELKQRIRDRCEVKNTTTRTHTKPSNIFVCFEMERSQSISQFSRPFTRHTQHELFETSCSIRLFVCRD